MTDSIFREVDDELRQERLAGLWSRYEKYAIAGAVIIVLAVAANEGWKYWQDGKAQSGGDAFVAALNAAETGDKFEAQAMLADIIANGTDGYPVLAAFRAAALLAEQGRVDEAVTAYDGLAAESGEAYFREVALLRAATLLVDKGDVAGVLSRVETMAADNQPAPNLARELIVLANIKSADYAEAGKWLDIILADIRTTGEMFIRASTYNAWLISLGEKAAPVAIEAGSEESTATPAE